MAKYIYESHLGGYFTSEEEIDFEYLYCEECGDSDWLIGQASSRAEAKELLWTDDYDSEDYEGSYIQKFIDEEWGGMKMAKYIDADALKRWIQAESNPYGAPTLDYLSSVKIMRHIDDMSAADVEPVRWNPITPDTMPKPYVNVIVCRPDTDGNQIVEQGYWCGNGWWKVFGTRTKNVSAWRKFPEPPKMDGGSE